MKIHDIAIDATIKKSKIKPSKNPKSGPKSWKFDQKNLNLMLDIHANEEYKNNRKVLMATRDFLHKSKFENAQSEKLYGYFSKIIDYWEKRFEKLNQ